MKLALITDSSATIAPKYRDHSNLFILDIPLMVAGHTYRSSDLSDEAYFELMRKSVDLPKTAQPSIVELEKLLTSLKEQAYTHVLGLFLSHEISGFYQNIFYLQDEFAPMVVKFPESRITSAPLGYMVDSALQGIDDGKSFNEILAKFEEQRAGNHAFMLVDDLKWLAKSGRLSNGSALLGTLLNIKPVLQFAQNGKVELFEKVRTSKKSTARLEELLLENSQADTYKVYVIHAEARERAEELYRFAQAQGYKDLELVTFGPVIATHLGLGSVAYAMTPKM